MCGSSNPLILADEASLGNVLHRSNSPSHLLGPVELQTNSEGKKINYEGTESEKPQARKNLKPEQMMSAGGIKPCLKQTRLCFVWQVV